ncbi:MFS transporter [Nocardioides sp. Root140]|nr:MFS transporter [Nocardioides sp. Root140]KRF14194.1 MFS transporter [Nocardioides sp. Soil796]
MAIRPLVGRAPVSEDLRVIDSETVPERAPKSYRVHPAWTVAVVAFVTLVGAAAFRSVPGILLDPLHHEFGWAHATIGSAVSLNLVLFGLISPFAAALMDTFGVRRVVVLALLLVSLGSGLTVFMTQPWHLVATWGLLVGVGTGSMSMAFVATVTSRWFVARRGLVAGILTAGSATGQLIFLPLIAMVAGEHGWRTASLLAAGAALAVVPIVAFWLRDHPHDLGITAYGATAEDPGPDRHSGAGSSAGRAIRVLIAALGSRTFWLLSLGFAICGMSTNGLIQTHFVPAAHDHGMPTTLAAGLLAVIGIFDVVGTIASGWLSDRVDPRLLLVVYYLLRGFSLMLLPSLLGPSVEPPTWAFIVFYGLDWVATVPPTVLLAREAFGADGPIVFGWIFASHQLGAAVAATGAGFIRDVQGTYAPAFVITGALCLVAAVASGAIRRVPSADPASPEPALMD